MQGYSSSDLTTSVLAHLTDERVAAVSKAPVSLSADQSDRDLSHSSTQRNSSRTLQWLAYGSCISPTVAAYTKVVSERNVGIDCLERSANFA